MSRRLNLFNIYGMEETPYRANSLSIYSIVNYCDARFIVALRAMARARPKVLRDLSPYLHQELVRSF